MDDQNHGFNLPKVLWPAACFIGVPVMVTLFVAGQLWLFGAWWAFFAIVLGFVAGGFVASRIKSTKHFAQSSDRGFWLPMNALVVIGVASGFVLGCFLLAPYVITQPQVSQATPLPVFEWIGANFEGHWWVLITVIVGIVLAWALFKKK